MEGAAPGTFIVHDAVVQFAEILVFIRERQAVQVFHFLEGFIALDDAVDAAQDAGHFRPVAAGGQGFQEGRHHVFPFPLEDIVDVFVVFQDLPGRIGYFRAADEDFRVREDLFHQVDEVAGHVDIPDVAGKADGISPKRRDVAQDVIDILIDRVFSHSHVDALVFTGRR